MHSLKQLRTVKPFIDLDLRFVSAQLCFVDTATFDTDNLLRYSVMFAARHPDYPRNAIFSVQIYLVEEDGDVELDTFTCNIGDAAGNSLVRDNQLSQSSTTDLLDLENKIYALVESPLFQAHINTARNELDKADLNVIH